MNSHEAIKKSLEGKSLKVFENGEWRPFVKPSQKAEVVEYMSGVAYAKNIKTGKLNPVEACK